MSWVELRVLKGFWDYFLEVMVLCEKMFVVIGDVFR